MHIVFSLTFCNPTRAASELALHLHEIDLRLCPLSDLSLKVQHSLEARLFFVLRRRQRILVLLATVSVRVAPTLLRRCEFVHCFRHWQGNPALCSNSGNLLLFQACLHRVPFILRDLQLLLDLLNLFLETDISVLGSKDFLISAFRFPSLSFCFFSHEGKSVPCSLQLFL